MNVIRVPGIRKLTSDWICPIALVIIWIDLSKYVILRTKCINIRKFRLYRHPYTHTYPTTHTHPNLSHTVTQTHIRNSAFHPNTHVEKTMACCPLHVVIVASALHPGQTNILFIRCLKYIPTRSIWSFLKKSSHRWTWSTASKTGIFLWSVMMHLTIKIHINLQVLTE